MKKLSIFIFAILLSFIIIGQANANLIYMGDVNTPDGSGGYTPVPLWYDDNQNITWWGATRPDVTDWYSAKLWPDYSEAPSGWPNFLPFPDTTLSPATAGLTGWRLPRANTDCGGIYCTDSEMGDLFWNTLGNTIDVDFYNEYGLIFVKRPINYGPFEDILFPFEYWANGPETGGLKQMFSFGSGEQDIVANDNEYYAIAVHDGPVLGTFPTRVPEPATMLLLGLGLVGLVEVRRKFKN